MKIREEIYAYGHENVLGNHETTIEITKKIDLTPKGDCIVGISATKACSDLKPEFKKRIKSRSKFVITLRVDHLSDTFEGYGSEKLLLLDEEDMVFRKSTFVCERTVLINCTKAARDINRVLIERLTNPGKKLSITIETTELNED